MKAVIYNGPYDVKVKDVPDAKIVRPRMYSSASPPPTFVGRTCTCMRAGPALNRDGFWVTKTGEVVEIGSGVERIKVGDYVCLPFNVGCGFAKTVKRSDRLLSHYQSGYGRRSLWFC